jgi:hypothetical protein
VSSFLLKDKFIQQVLLMALKRFKYLLVKIVRIVNLGSMNCNYLAIAEMDLMNVGAK